MVHNGLPLSLAVYLRLRRQLGKPLSRIALEELLKNDAFTLRLLTSLAQMTSTPPS